MTKTKAVQKKAETSTAAIICTSEVTVQPNQTSAEHQRTVSQTHRSTKHFRLTCWRLLYHVDVQKVLDRQNETDACRHSRLSLDLWDEQKTLFPQEWAKLLAKRQRRLEWFIKHGSVPDGETPPDPLDPRRTAHEPIHAYLARHGLTLDEFWAKYARIPMKRKKGGHKPNWPMIRRVLKWVES